MHAHTHTHTHAHRHTHADIHIHTQIHTHTNIQTNTHIHIILLWINHSSVETKLLLFSQQAGLKQIVAEATDYVNYTDLVFMSHDDLMLNINVNIPFSTSDHSSIELIWLLYSLLIMYPILSHVQKIVKPE